MGIIPALAGNTRTKAQSADTSRDHPRSRGEYTPETYQQAKAAGSSPLSRGIHPRNLPTSQGRRIIPALAGNTSRPASTLGRRTDHPRSRGEYSRRASCSSRERGSSPLSRGIRLAGPKSLIPSRIIPALAGNTQYLSAVFWLSRDHPRSRGEYCNGARAVATTKGSSPLSRGIPAEVLEAEDLLGIIPALAGNTATGRGHGVVAQDHPRSRGEYLGTAASDDWITGSSPLSRGIRPWLWRPPRPPRIIPALAGNTPKLW